MRQRLAAKCHVRCTPSQVVTQASGSVCLSVCLSVYSACSRCCKVKHRAAAAAVSDLRTERSALAMCLCPVRRVSHAVNTDRPAGNSTSQHDRAYNARR